MLNVLKAGFALMFLFGVVLAQHHHGGGHSPKPSSTPVTQVNLTVQSGWIRLTPPTLKDTTVYMTLLNPTAQNLKLIGGASPIAQMVMPMADYKEQKGGQTVQGMRTVEFLSLPAKGRLELAPGGKHLMLMGLKRPLKEGEKIPLTLIFEGNLQASLELTVQNR